MSGERYPQIPVAEAYRVLEWCFGTDGINELKIRTTHGAPEESDIGLDATDETRDWMVRVVLSELDLIAEGFVPYDSGEEFMPPPTQWHELPPFVRDFERKARQTP
jgi:hypothetical protein